MAMLDDSLYQTLGTSFIEAGSYIGIAILKRRNNERHKVLG